MIYLLLVISASINGHLHDSDLPGHERDRQRKKARKEKLWLNCHRLFFCPPLQVWAQKSLPGRVVPGTSLADGSVNMGRDNPQPKEGTQILGRPGLLLEMLLYPH